MDFEINGNPDFGDLTVRLKAGEAFWSQSGAMSRMSRDTQVTTRLVGGFLQALLRKALGGESLFIAEYSSPAGGFVAFAPEETGSILRRTLDGGTFNLTAGSFLACTPGLTLRTKFGGLRAFFSGEGAFFIECAGTGELFFSAYGGVLEKQIDGTLTVDTGHLVAWEPTLTYTIGGMGGLKQTLFSGEGLVMNFSGKGKIWLQTRNVKALAGWLSPLCR